ncbi:shoc2 [Symbiodinium microadriaticum]|nr:shoc2 [Symbiodinium microadriaticum]CAE7945703.1 shoc2 [Symbiodinium sp. KB8]
MEQDAQRARQSDIRRESDFAPSHYLRLLKTHNPNLARLPATGKPKSGRNKGPPQLQPLGEDRKDRKDTENDHLHVGALTSRSAEEEAEVAAEKRGIKSRPKAPKEPMVYFTDALGRRQASPKAEAFSNPSTPSSSRRPRAVSPFQFPTEISETTESRETLKQQWSLAQFLLRDGLEAVASDSAIMRTARGAQDCLEFLDLLEECAGKLGMRTGALSRMLLPFNSETDSGDQANSALEAPLGSPELEGLLSDRERQELVQRAVALRRLVRVKVADCADVQQARDSLQLIANFLNALRKTAEEEKRSLTCILRELCYAFIGGREAAPTAEDLGQVADAQNPSAPCFSSTQAHGPLVNMLPMVCSTRFAAPTACNLRCFWVILAASGLAASSLEASSAPALPPLSLDNFEDDDCIESGESDVLLHLMHELGGVLEQVLSSITKGEVECNLSAVCWESRFSSFSCLCCIKPAMDFDELEELERKRGASAPASHAAERIGEQFLRAAGAKTFQELQDKKRLEIASVQLPELSELPFPLRDLRGLEMLLVSRSQVRGLPSSIGDLSGLQFLDVSANCIEILPETILSLKSLTHLNISDNKLGKLPSPFGRLTSLAVFNAKKNLLREVPEDIDELPLEDLDMTENRLESLPMSIGRLSRLRSFWAAGNQVAQLPPDMGRCLCLRGVQLAHNMLEALPSEICTLTNLQYLDLAQNWIMELPPLENLTGLQTLDVGSNCLVSLNFGVIPSLRKLLAPDNRIERLPPRFADFLMLHTLDLQGNPIANSLQRGSKHPDWLSLWLLQCAGALRSLPGVQDCTPSLLNDGTLALDGWQLRGEMSSTLTRLRGVSCLKAADNRITLLPEDLGSMAGLDSLLLSHNELSKLPDTIGGLDRLQLMDVSANQLLDLTAGFISLKSLRQLDLSKNRLSALPDGWGRLTSLQHADLSMNRLIALPTDFGHLPALRWLSLAGNEIVGLPVSFKQLRQLTELHCEGTPLASLLLQTGEMFEQRILWELNQWGRLALIKLQMQQRGPVPDGLVQCRWVPATPPEPPPQTKAAAAHGYGPGEAPMPQSQRKDGSARSGGMDEAAKVVQGLRSRLDSAGDEPEAQRRLRQMFREWHPDKRSEAEQQLATRVFQWLQDVKSNYARCITNVRIIIITAAIYTFLTTTSTTEKAWAVFDKWSAEGRADAMQQLAPAVLARPYCEPGKLAWLATTCILLLRGADAKQALECASSLDEDLLGQMTVLSYETKHNTRFHLVLRSPWPAFRMLDLLARLIPETPGHALCIEGDPDVFDWPQFKKLLSEAVDELVSDESVFDLRPSDGPLSQQYSARWQRIHSLPAMKEVVYFSHDVFDAYRQHHYKAGCHLGVISCYILQIFVVLLRDIEGRLHKQVASVAQLVNIYGPVQQTAKTDWPVFRLLHFASLLQRAHPHDIWRGNQDNEHAAARDAAKSLVTEVDAVTETKFASGGEAAPMAFLTSAWGWMSKILDAVLKRWRVVSKTSPLLVLCRDHLALRNCKTSQKFNDKRPLVQCIDAPQRLGVETMVAKYIAMASIARSGMHAVWLDLDVFIVADPSPFVMSELARQPSASLLFSRHMLSESVTPAVVIARPTEEAVSLLMGFASWLRENPYLLDHKAWDQFLTNNKGDFAGVFDYKGRNTTGHETEGPTHTFLPRVGLASINSNWSFIKSGFSSGDGWRGREEDVVLFHFWGAEESPEELFRIFYNKKALLSPALDPNAEKILQKYRREPVSAPLVSVLLKKEPLYLVAISYAHGCCRKSLQRNREHALQAGVDAARSYGKQHLGPDWLAANHQVLSQKRGAGWWLWKPYVILKTLKDPSIPWDKGVVLWVDAGNYLHADPRPFLSSALEESDVVALRLKQCLEVDWTSKLTLEQMNMSSRYALIDRPQLGAYFLAFRKTKAVLSFVEQWLKLSEDPDILMGLAVRNLNSHGGTGTLTSDILDDEVPSFMTHQADQSIFSLLFKRHGYRASSLEAGHTVVTLDRWRE